MEKKDLIGFKFQDVIEKYLVEEDEISPDRYVNHRKAIRQLEEKIIELETKLKEQMENSEKIVKSRNSVVLDNGTILEVGGKYKKIEWDNDSYFIPSFIMDKIMLGVTNEGKEKAYSVYDWLPYEEEKTEKWYEFECYYEHEDAGALYQTVEYGKNINSIKESVENDWELVIYKVLREWDSKEKMLEDLKK